MIEVIVQATDLYIWAWPVTFFVIALAVVAVWQLWKAGALRSRAMAVLSVSSVAALVSIPTLAGAFWANPATDTPETQALPELFLHLMACAYLIAVVIAVSLAEENWVAVAALAAMPMWIIFGFYFTSAMAISGVWL